MHEFACSDRWIEVSANLREHVLKMVAKSEAVQFVTINWGHHDMYNV